MPLKRKLDFGCGYAAAVILNFELVQAAAAHLDVDARRAGVERVLDQLFGDRSWPLDHLAGGDLGGHRRLEHSNGHAFVSDWPSEQMCERYCTIRSAVMCSAYKEFLSSPWSTIPPHLKDAGKTDQRMRIDRKSTRLNSSHITISYAVFCLKKKKKK